jgi:hypothetical protein
MYILSARVSGPFRRQSCFALATSPFERVRAGSLHVMQSRRMGGAKRCPSMPRAECAEDNGFRFALPILRKHTFAISRRVASEVCIFVWPIRGRREDRVLAAPAVSRAICANKTAHEHTGQLEHSGLPCAMALRLTSCSSRRTALLPPSPALLIARLTPAPRRPNHTTSPYASGAHV